MRIVIVNTHIPFIYGGAEILVNDLKEELLSRGFEVEVVMIPFKWYPLENVSKHILANRLLDLEESAGNKIDLVITTKFPTYFIKHPNKVLWLLHQHRTAYDLWDSIYCDIPKTAEGIEVKKMIMKSDNNYLPEHQKIYTISENIKNRLKKFNGFDGKVLYPPLKDTQKYYCKDYKDYIIYVSRLTKIKRQHVAIEAMKYTKTNLKLIIIGKPDNVNYEMELHEQVKSNKLENKVEFLSYVDDKKKFDLLSNCRGVIFIPTDEDYGYVTLEAMYSSKPLLTFRDSGGPVEFINNGENGFITDPDSKSLAEAIDKLDDKKLAKKLGENAHKDIKDKNINWDNVIFNLVGKIND